LKDADSPALPSHQHHRKRRNIPSKLSLLFPHHPLFLQIINLKGRGKKRGEEGR
jgi:hypothetical protein